MSSRDGAASKVDGTDTLLMEKSKPTRSILFLKRKLSLLTDKCSFSFL